MSGAVAVSTAIARPRRVAYAAAAGLCGWLAGQLACTPINLVVAARDSEGQGRLFVETMLYGSLAWGGWTLLLGGVAWLLVVVPLVLTIRPCLLVRLRYAMLGATALVALCLAGSRIVVFHDPIAPPLPARFAQIAPYAAFALAFSLVTAWVYIAMSKRRMDRLAAAG